MQSIDSTEMAFYLWSIITVLTAYIVYNHFRYTTDTAEKMQLILPQYELVIGVLSAQDHFEHRSAVRDTWMTDIVKNNTLRHQILVKFVIGSVICEIHPDDRLDEYGCEISNIDAKLGFNSEIFAFDLMTEENWMRSLSIKHTTKIAFKVNHAVVIKKLGILSNTSGNQSFVNVRLINLVTDDVVVSCTINTKFDEAHSYEYRFKDVEAYMLPKGFEGSVEADIPNISITDELKNMHSKPDNSGLITFNQQTSTKHFLSVLSFVFTAYDKETLQKHMDGKDNREKQWLNYTHAVKERLLTEKQQHGDIVFVNVTDVYRNLPKKLNLFHKWVSSHVIFTSLLKTDDDCFVNAAEVYEKYQTFYKSHCPNNNKCWWSQFRRDWAVEVFGKWGDSEYTAPAYPMFGCGSGNVLSADLVHWLANNSGHLKYYQGEDVSMGIWLSAVGPTFIGDDQWQCANTCREDMYNLPELTPDQLHKIWNDKTTCGNPWGCL